MGTFSCLISDLAKDSEAKRNRMNTLPNMMDEVQEENDVPFNEGKLNTATFIFNENSVADTEESIMKEFKKRAYRFSAFNPKDVIEGFNSFRIETYHPSQALINRFTDFLFKPRDTEYVITGINENTGVREIILALPMQKIDANGREVNGILEILRSEFKNLPIDISKSKLRELIVNANPSRLNKFDKNKPYNLNELRRLYGEDYQYFFSSPYVITDDDNNLSRTTKDNGTGSLIGKSVIFYKKFPDGVESVDSYIQSQGVHRFIGQERDSNVGMIVLNQAMYNSMSSALGAYSDFITKNKLPVDSKFIIGQGQLDYLLTSIPSQLYPKALQFTATPLYDTYNKTYDTTELVYFLLSPEGSTLVAAMDKIIRENMEASKKGIENLPFALGLQANMPIRANVMKSTSIAPIAFTVEEHQEEAFNMLEVAGLGNIPVLTPNIEIYFGNTDREILESLNYLKTIDIPIDNYKSTAKETLGLNFTNQSSVETVKPDIKKLQTIMDGLGINLKDAQTFVSAYLRPLAITKENQNFETEMLNLLGIIKNCS